MLNLKNPQVHICSSAGVTGVQKFAGKIHLNTTLTPRPPTHNVVLRVKLIPGLVTGGGLLVQTTATIQNHGMIQVGGDLWSSPCPTFCSPQV